MDVSTIDEFMGIAISGPSHEDYTGGVIMEQTAYIEGLIIAFNDHFLPFGKN